MLQRSDETSASVNAQKILTLDNQQGSPEQGNLQRLSGNAEYTQAGGKREQPVHTCKDCGTQDLTLFGIRSDYNRPWNHCRACRQARNIDTQRARAQRDDVKKKKAEHDKKYSLANSEKISESHKKYQAANRENLTAASKKRYEANKEHHLAVASQWKKDNAGVVNQTCMKRHAAKMMRVPKWLTEADRQSMNAIYTECKKLNKEAGRIKYHVDHEYPLQGKTVSGLHVPGNLQIILASLNCSKQNRLII